MSTIFNDYTADTGNPALFETFKPKIQAYKNELEKSILKEYRIPAELIPKEDGVDVTGIPKKVLSEKEYDITESSATSLVKSMADGSLSATDVFKAFARHATIAHQLTNCAMQLYMEEGLERAHELDQYYKRTGRTIGPLHGLPVSLKEHCGYKGKITHSSFVSLIDNIDDRWALTVETLKNLGAVFFIRTTEPQCLLHLCSFNNITGYCCNPRNTRLTPGGSSSGEGALAAMHGSAFGLGSDIGGSIRCPAAFCGVWGLRPTQKRISTKDIPPKESGVQEGVLAVLGPLARSADDINLFMKSLISAKPWENDANVIPLPWRDVPSPDISSLTIAIYYDDGVCKPTPPVLRGLYYAAEKLKHAGATVVEWKAIDVEKLMKTVGNFYNGDGGKELRLALAASGEPVHPLSKIAMSYGCGPDGVTVPEFQKCTLIRDTYRNIYADTMQKNSIDYILAPAYVSVAPKLGKDHYIGYTGLWNILDFPGIVFPTGLSCDPSLDTVDRSYKQRNDVEAYEYSLYDDSELFKGAPINLQMIGRRWFEEELVQAGKVVCDCISK